MPAYHGDRRYPRLEVNQAGVLENMDSGGQEQVTVVNFSGDGLCIESDGPYSQATKVRLRVAFGPSENPHKSYAGEVLWCNAVKRKGTRRYESGVKITGSDPGLSGKALGQP
jgi:hypothetical protein